MVKVPELKKFFSEAQLPPSIRLNQGTEITDVKRFLDSHFAAIDKNPGNKTYMPYYNRLVEVYKKLKQET